MVSLKIVVTGCVLLAALAAARMPNKANRSMWNTLPVAPSPMAGVEFTLVLQQRNLHQLEKLYWERTNPNHEDFAKWLTIEEINDLVAPPQDEIDLITSYLTEKKIHHKVYGDFIKCFGSVATLESVFGVTFLSFEHKERGDVIVRTEDTATIPEYLKNHSVRFVMGLSKFPLEDATSGDNSLDDGKLKDYVIPRTIDDAYNVTVSGATNAQTTQAVVEFSRTAGISIEDLFNFEQLVGVPKQNISYTVGDFKFSPINPVNGEATLDAQYAIGVGTNVDTAFWIVDGWMYDFAILVQQRQQDKQPVPWVFSMSYGYCEKDQCELIPEGGTTCRQLGVNYVQYMNITDVQFQKIGLTGVTIIGISQDAGAAGKCNIDCKSRTPINPSYPGSSPYVLSVGATMMDPQKALTTDLPPACTEAGNTCLQGGTEVVCTVPQALITSGGGFSDSNPGLPFQSGPVSAWQNSGALQPPTSMYTATNRAYPDMAALGHQYLIVENGKQLAVDGTSASAPVVCGLVSFLNDDRFNNGKGPIGPLTQIVWTMAQSNPSTFNDITSGNNTGTEGDLGGCHIQYGYGAAPGWDPVTGWGSFNFGNTLDYIRGLAN